VEKPSRSAIRLQVSPGHSGVHDRTVGGKEPSGVVVGLSCDARMVMLTLDLSQSGEWSFPQLPLASNNPGKACKPRGKSVLVMDPRPI